MPQWIKDTYRQTSKHEFDIYNPHDGENRSFSSYHLTSTSVLLCAYTIEINKHKTL